jgi:hypothetical protein
MCLSLRVAGRCTDQTRAAIAVPGIPGVRTTKRGDQPFVWLGMADLRLAVTVPGLG